MISWRYFTLRSSGSTNLLTTVSNAADASTVDDIILGTPGSINPDITSPLESNASEPAIRYGLIKPDPAFASGGLSNSDTWPVAWLVMHMGSLGLSPDDLGPSLNGPSCLYELDGADREIVTLSPSWAGSSGVLVANRCVRALPEGVCTCIVLKKF